MEDIKSNEQEASNSKFVLRLAYISGFHGYKPVTTNKPLYLYKSVNRNRFGYTQSKVTPDLGTARVWATKKGAEGYLAKHFTFSPDENGVESSYVVERIN